MATIDQLKKHYDKLTAPERFALMIRAAARDDQSAERELVDSAPKVNWEFPHTVGLTHGFRQLVNYHVAQQLGAAGTFFMLMYLWQDEASADLIQRAEEAEIPGSESALGLIARRFLEDKKAFETVCQEYNVDALGMEGIYSPYPMLSATMAAVTGIGFADNTELTDLESTIAQYRALIEDSREYWAEAKAK